MRVRLKFATILNNFFFYFILFYFIDKKKINYKYLLF